MGKKIDFVFPSARTPHGAYVWMGRRTRDKLPTQYVLPPRRYADTGVDDHAVDFVPPVMVPTLLTQAMLNAKPGGGGPQQGDIYGADEAMDIYDADYAPPGEGSSGGSGSGAPQDEHDDFYAVPDGVAVTSTPDDAGGDGAGQGKPGRMFSSSGEVTWRQGPPCRQSDATCVYKDP